MSIPEIGTGKDLSCYRSFLQQQKKFIGPFFAPLARKMGATMMKSSLYARICLGTFLTAYVFGEYQMTHLRLQRNEWALAPRVHSLVQTNPPLKKVHQQALTRKRPLKKWKRYMSMHSGAMQVNPPNHPHITCFLLIRQWRWRPRARGGGGRGRGRGRKSILFQWTICKRPPTESRKAEY